MPWTPNIQNPTIFDGEPFPNVIQSPPRIVREIQVPPGWTQNDQSLVDAAERIIDANSGKIDQFVATNRRDVANGTVSVVDRALDYEDLSLRYAFQFGQETITMIARPTNSGGGRSDFELNLDGYLALVNLNQYPTAFSGSIRYTFQCNGVTFYVYNAALKANTALLFAFGKTGLRCQSLIDKSSDDPNLPGNPNADTPPGLFGKVLPARKDVAQFTNSFGGSIKSHPDLPGYFVYDMGHVLNQGGNASLNDLNSPQKVPNPTIIKLVQVPGPDSVEQSPLKNYDLNKFRVLLTPSTPFLSSWSWQYELYAEFYSRLEIRSAVSSWTIRDAPGNIPVNDKPLYWAILTGAYPIQAIDVDLTPKNVDTTLPTIFNPPTSYTVGQDGSPTLWNDPARSRGVWRPGDQAPYQPQPPNGLWPLAQAAAQQAFTAWCAMLGRFAEMGIYLVPISAAIAKANNIKTTRYSNQPLSAYYYPFSIYEQEQVFRSNPISVPTGNPKPLTGAVTTQDNLTDPLNTLIVTPHNGSNWISDISAWIAPSPFTPTKFPQGEIIKSVQDQANFYGIDVKEYETGTYTIVGENTITTVSIINTFPYSIVGNYAQTCETEMNNCFDILSSVTGFLNTTSEYAADNRAVEYLQQLVTSMGKLDPIVKFMTGLGINYELYSKTEIVYTDGSGYPPVIVTSDQNLTVGGLPKSSLFLRTTTPLDPSWSSYAYPFFICNDAILQTQVLCAIYGNGAIKLASQNLNYAQKLYNAINQYQNDILK